MVCRLISLIFALWFACYPAFAQTPEQAQGTQSELARNAVSLKPVPCIPTKGVQTNLSDLLRAEDAAKVINNLHMTKRGIWTARSTGWAKHANTQHNSGATILEVLPYLDSSNVAKLLFRAGGKYYDYNIGTSTATEIGSGFGSSDIPCMRVYGRPTYAGPINAFFADGVHELKKWTGSGSMATSAWWPQTVAGRVFTKPKFLEEYQGRGILAGFDAYKQAVLISDATYYDYSTISSPAAATDGGWIDVPASLGPVAGLKTVRLNDSESVCLIGCENGVAMLVGTDAESFAIREITREFGIPSNRTWITIQNDTYFLATDGIRRYSTNSISGLLNSRKTAVVQDLINRINRSAASKAFAFYHPATQEAQFWFPIDSDTTPKNCLVANFNTAEIGSADDADTRPIFSTKNGITVPCAGETNGTAWAGTTNGYLMILYSGDTYDGSAITWTFVGPLIGANNPAQSSSMRRWTIMTDGGDQKFDATAYTLTQRTDGTTGWVVADTATMSVTAESITAIDTWGSGTTTTYPKFIDFYPKGSGRYWQLKLSGDATDEHISLVGSMAFVNVGGMRQ